jgi:hypothetical protein
MCARRGGEEIRVVVPEIDESPVRHIEKSCEAVPAKTRELAGVADRTADQADEYERRQCSGHETTKPTGPEHREIDAAARWRI